MPVSGSGEKITSMLLSAADAVAPAVDQPAQAPAEHRSAHLWQVDIVRLLTFSAVISVHSLAFTEAPDNPVAAGFMMLLQYGREVFFALTGFVLVYSATNRRLQLRSFWSKRILYVAVPYVT